MKAYSIPHLLRKMILTLGLLATVAAAQAVSLTFECKVANYSGAGWIEVRTGSNTGGRVVYDSRTGRYYTDRVQRGEALRITCSPTVSREYAVGGFLYTLNAPNPMALFASAPLPVSRVISCPTNPSWDNVYVGVETSSGYYERRIPIGQR